MKFINGLLLAFALLLVGALLSTLIGYFFGMTLAIIPFFNGLITDAIPVTKQQLPTVFAWVFLIVGMIGAQQYNQGET